METALEATEGGTMNLPSHASKNACAEVRKEARERIAEYVRLDAFASLAELAGWLADECDELDGEYQSARKECAHWHRVALEPGQRPESPENSVRTVKTGCLQCGMPLTPSPRGGPRKRYCGPACRYRYRHTRERSAVEKVNEAAVNLRAVFAHLVYKSCETL